MTSDPKRLEIHRGAYAERRDAVAPHAAHVAAGLAAPLIGRLRARAAAAARMPALVTAAERSVRGIDDHGLRGAAAEVGARLQREGFRGADAVARAFAVVREAAQRTIGERHHDVQLVGGRLLLAGLVAEMETGEGKTLTATLAAGTAALAGIPVHVVTMNDYLAARDADWMGPVYRALGLSVGVIVHGMDDDARRAAYRCDVTYCANKEIAFDYLRDRLVLGRHATRVQLELEALSGERSRARRLVLRGLHYAVVDEVDSVLVDEARTPLVIAGRGDTGAERHVYEQALALGDRMEQHRDYRIDARERQVELTDQGRRRLDDFAEPLGGVWASRLRREQLVRQALAARHLFHRDRHYLVTGQGTVAIVDEFTGRLMPDRAWELGLHQLIEVKEQCPLTARSETLARISYQRFFRRYLRLAGMSGTAREVARELWAVYGLGVVRVATNRPGRRRPLRGAIHATAAERWDAVLGRAATIHREGRPVLIGTRSVAASEELSARLTAASLPHRVLNARQDREEAQLVAQAGHARQITVATNMAGRGTDIRLGPGVAELGGLHVIATERHEARRIDRQLFGRAGRQGDPGTFEAIVSLEDDVIVHYGGLWRRLAVAVTRSAPGLASVLGRLAVAHAQRVAERLHARARKDLLRTEEDRQRALAFSGPLE